VAGIATIGVTFLQGAVESVPTLRPMLAAVFQKSAARPEYIPPERILSHIASLDGLVLCPGLKCSKPSAAEEPARTIQPLLHDLRQRRGESCLPAGMPVAVLLIVDHPAPCDSELPAQGTHPTRATPVDLHAPQRPGMGALDIKVFSLNSADIGLESALSQMALWVTTHAYSYRERRKKQAWLMLAYLSLCLLVLVVQGLLLAWHWPSLVRTVQAKQQRQRLQELLLQGEKLLSFAGYYDAAHERVDWGNWSAGARLWISQSKADSQRASVEPEELAASFEKTRQDLGQALLLAQVLGLDRQDRAPLRIPADFQADQAADRLRAYVPYRVMCEEQYWPKQVPYGVVAQWQMAALDHLQRALEPARRRLQDGIEKWLQKNKDGTLRGAWREAASSLASDPGWQSWRELCRTLARLARSSELDPVSSLMDFLDVPEHRLEIQQVTLHWYSRERGVTVPALRPQGPLEVRVTSKTAADQVLELVPQEAQDGRRCIVFSSHKPSVLTIAADARMTARVLLLDEGNRSWVLEWRPEDYGAHLLPCTCLALPPSVRIAADNSPDPHITSAIEFTLELPRPLRIPLLMVPSWR